MSIKIRKINWDIPYNELLDCAFIYPIKSDIPYLSFFIAPNSSNTKFIIGRDNTVTCGKDVKLKININLNVLYKIDANGNEKELDHYDKYVAEKYYGLKVQWEPDDEREFPVSDGTKLLVLHNKDTRRVIGPNSKIPKLWIRV